MPDVCPSHLSPFSTLVRSLPCLAFSKRGWWPSTSSPDSLHDLSNRAPSPQGAVLWTREKDETWGIEMRRSTLIQTFNNDKSEWWMWWEWEQEKNVAEGREKGERRHLTWCRGGRWCQIWFEVCCPPLAQICCRLCRRSAWSVQCTETWGERKQKVRLLNNDLPTGWVFFQNRGDN